MKRHCLIEHEDELNFNEDENSSKKPKVHTTYSCDKCGKRFTRADYLNEHMKIHDSYQCPKCNKIFDNLIAFNIHDQEEHFIVSDIIKVEAIGVEEFITHDNVNMGSNVETHVTTVMIDDKDTSVFDDMRAYRFNQNKPSSA